MAKIQDSCWEIRLKVVLELFFQGMNLSNNPVMVNQILLPILEHIYQLISNESFSKAKLDFTTGVCYSDWSSGN